MESLDFASYGVHMVIQTNHPPSLDRVRLFLPPGWQPAEDSEVDATYSLIVADGTEVGSPAHRLYLGSERVMETQDLDLLLDRLASDVHHRVAMSSMDALFVHAGVVGWQGRAVVVPGRSFSGKSTLVAEMVRAGALYYSDEYAVFDDEGRVHPYPKLLSMRHADDRGGPRLRARRLYAPDALGSSAGAEALPLGLVVVTRYEPGAAWDPGPLSQGQALLALLDNTVLARIRPDATLEILGRALSGATALSGVRGEADETAALILNRLQPAVDARVRTR